MSEKSFGTHTTKRVLVHGWYYQGNLGDDLFMDAFKHLFPSYSLTFVNYITLHDLQNTDAVFIGGGSFLSEPLSIEDDSALEKLKQLPIFYIGVGGETDIHPTHHDLISIAKLVAIRSLYHLDKIKKINTNTIVIPDLVYSLSDIELLSKLDKSILILPNAMVIPKWNEPHWKHTAWEQFKNELAQLLDELIDLGYQINFLPLSLSDEFNDHAAAQEIVGRMIHRESRFFLNKKNNAVDVIKLISQYSVVITQRYHGIVLSEMAQVPYLSIYHHDKLKNCLGSKLCYYGTYKSQILEQLNSLLKMKTSNILPIDRDIFSELTQKVEYALCGHQE